MSRAVSFPKLGQLGTTWPVPSFEGFRPYFTSNYETGHYVRGGKAGLYARLESPKLGQLDTTWSVPSFAKFRPYSTRNYETGYHVPGEKGAFLHALAETFHAS